MKPDWLEFVEKNWSALTEAPLPFIILPILTGVLVFLVLRWAYRHRIEHLKGTSDLLNERLKAKDEQLGHYRERLRIAPETEAQLSRFSNPELQKRALDLVGSIRTFLSERCSKDPTFRLVGGSMSEEDRNRALQKMIDDTLLHSAQIMADFETQFKVDTILLRDEILSRLPGSSKGAQDFQMYERPTNRRGIEAVADSLERLAKSLPEQAVSAAGNSGAG